MVWIAVEDCEIPWSIGNVIHILLHWVKVIIVMIMITRSHNEMLPNEMGSR